MHLKKSLWMQLKVKKLVGDWGWGSFTHRQWKRIKEKVRAPERQSVNRKEQISKTARYKMKKSRRLGHPA